MEIFELILAVWVPGFLAYVAWLVVLGRRIDKNPPTRLLVKELTLEIEHKRRPIGLLKRCQRRFRARCIRNRKD